jgi:hypothetical protein
MLMLNLIRIGMCSQGAVTLVADGVESDVAAISVGDAALDAAEIPGVDGGSTE